MKRRLFTLAGVTSGLSFSSLKSALNSNYIHTEKTSNLVAVMRQNRPQGKSEADTVL